jgi:hypothetical protein
MATDISELFSDERLWLSLLITAFAATGLVYSEFGFVQGFLPLLFAIYALRQYLRFTAKDEQSNTTDEQQLVEKYDVDPDQEYTPEEQIKILMRMRSEYSKKRVLWGVLGALSFVVGGLFIPVSVIIMLISFLIMGYCFLQLYRSHQIVSRINMRVKQLENA